MTDGEITAALANLGLDRHNYRAVALLPLIEVAWSDGRIQRAERDLIGRIAARYGMDPGDAWIDRWLKRRPASSTFLGARTVLLALMSRAGDDTSSPETLSSLLDLCQRVAEAAGGLLGLAFTVERAERDCIEEIATSLALGPRIPSAIVKAWQTTQRPPPPPLPKRKKRVPPPNAFSEATTRLRPVRPVRSPPRVPGAAAQDTAPPIAPDTITPPPEPDPDLEDDPTVPFADGISAPLPAAYVETD